MAVDFYRSAGTVALGSRLRRLGELFARDAAALYAQYDVAIDPRWYPVCAVLAERDEVPIKDLALAIGQSHAAVSQVVRSLVAAELAQTSKCCEDSRVSRVTLTDTGRAEMARMAAPCRDAAAAVDELLEQHAPAFWSSLDRLEGALEERSFYDRVSRVRAMRAVDVVPFDAPRHAAAFRALNLAWIRKHWEPEPSDYAVLDDPQGAIIEAGGFIAMAERDGVPVGTCALLPLRDGAMELAKMSVADGHRGLGIGERLGRRVIEVARERGARRVYLESNAVLEPAINLYRKLGFEPVPQQPTCYARCNVQMALRLDDL